MKKIFFLIFVIFIFTSCGIKNENNNPVKDMEVQKAEIEVSASIVPIASLVNTIGGKYVDAQAIVPAGVSPHGFDLSARQMSELSDDQVVFMLGLEHIDGFLMEATDTEIQLHLGDGIELLESTPHDHDEHEEDEHEEHHDEEDNHDEDEHGEDDHTSDPHVWLGKDNIILIAEKIRDRLSEIMPEQSKYFAENTETFKTELEAIYANFGKNISGKSLKEFIVFHDAYNYLLESA